MTEQVDLDALIAEARNRGDALRTLFPNDGDIRDDARLYETLADALESVYADSLTAQAEHARWQERAEKAERAGERILADALARSAELRKERERAAALAEQGTEEPDDPDAVFEYRVRNDVAGFLSETMTLSGAQDEAKIDPHDFVERRRKPDEWTPVEQGDDDADR